jgi:hypothetical protein
MRYLSIYIIIAFLALAALVIAFNPTAPPDPEEDTPAPILPRWRRHHLPREKMRRIKRFGSSRKFVGKFDDVYGRNS